MRVVENKGGQLTVELDLELYSEAAVFKCLYWYGKDFDVTPSRGPEGKCLTVVLRPTESKSASADWAALERKLRRDLIDFQTRQYVAEETRAVRELIVAKALAAMDPLPLPPPGDVTDPVGFDPAVFDDKQG